MVSGQNPTGQNPTGQNPTGQNPTGQNPTDRIPQHKKWTKSNSIKSWQGYGFKLLGIRQLANEGWLPWQAQYGR